MAQTATAIVGGEDDILVREDWALTWPIWHMLSRQERKDIAQQHGYKTIGEFEEHMILQRAVDDSSSAVPYENRLIYSSDERRQAFHKEEAMPAIAEGAAETNGEDDDEEAAAELAEHKLAQEQEDNHDVLQGRAVNDEILKLGGRILILPDEMLHRAFSFLPVDAYATLARVSPHWQSFTRTEAVYKRLCERLYLNQSKRRALFVSRFDNSYRLMLERRPRVKAGGGAYETWTMDDVLEYWNSLLPLLLLPAKLEDMIADSVVLLLFGQVSTL
jgi:F-box protein 9